MPAPDGLLVVDKPAGWTSHDVVGRARRLCGTRKVGHAGTLDPMATGVLVLGIGPGHPAADLPRRLRQGLHRHHPARAEHHHRRRRGRGHRVRGRRRRHPGSSSRRPCAALTGDIQQVPSSVSAIKVNGRALLRPGPRGRGRRAAARPGDASAGSTSSATRAGRRGRHTGARRGRRGDGELRHLRPRAGPRPRRGARRRRPPHRAAPHPGRRVHPRPGARPRGARRRRRTPSRCPVTPARRRGPRPVRRCAS